MELLIREFNENAVDGTVESNGQPERAKRALHRLNAIHDQYSSMILYRDMMYVLSVFMTSPQHWMSSRWSWRECSSSEKECIFWHWVDIGELMNIHVREHFTCMQDVVEYKHAYEEKHMQALGYGSKNAYKEKHRP